MKRLTHFIGTHTEDLSYQTLSGKHCTLDMTWGAFFEGLFYFRRSAHLSCLDGDAIGSCHSFHLHRVRVYVLNRNRGLGKLMERCVVRRGFHSIARWDMFNSSPRSAPFLQFAIFPSQMPVTTRGRLLAEQKIWKPKSSCWDLKE